MLRTTLLTLIYPVGWVKLEIKAKRFNIGINNHELSNSASVNSLFGIIPSSTDGLELQNAMREQ
ncbi:hypothetical protein [Candidatus Marithrix sp. Canyon 246]|uniref:hypothetical protein n=1 Tax=Candidatus Marithrix sp. Canyon 246 TaxID=1827136 RepID=UPI000849FC20|nr:hypothetical protein [Candidatus Marithrix sp. Canyon 246]